jgi:hypothetical protein
MMMLRKSINPPMATSKIHLHATSIAAVVLGATTATSFDGSAAWRCRTLTNPSGIWVRPHFAFFSFAVRIVDVNSIFVTMSSVKSEYFIALPSIPHVFELFWCALVFFEKVLFAAAFDIDATFAVFAAFFTAAVGTADAVVGDPPASGMLQLYAAAPQTSRFPI